MSGRMWVLTKRPTTVRMLHHLRALGLTRAQHDAWCGFSLAGWISANLSWSERDWHELVLESVDCIRSQVMASETNRVGISRATGPRVRSAAQLANDKRLRQTAALRRAGIS